jgi:hypothetical protein
MSLDAKTSQLTQHGTVTVEAGGIVVTGFAGDNCSCRDVAVLACIWAIGELQRELMKDVEQPGGGRVAIGSAEDPDEDPIEYDHMED